MICRTKNEYIGHPWSDLNLFKVNQNNKFLKKMMYNVPRVEFCLRPGEVHGKNGSGRMGSLSGQVSFGILSRGLVIVPQAL